MVAGLVTTVAGAAPSRATTLARGQSVSQAVTEAGSAPLAAPYVPKYGAYLGLAPNFVTNVSKVVLADEVGADIHRMFGIVSFYSSWDDTPLTKQFAAAAAQGSIPMVSMHCTGPDADVVAGDEDALIEAQAEAYKAYGGPILFRWFWEMNWPTVNGNAICLGTTGAAGYVAAYVHIWKIFQSVGATNVAFVWAPSASPGSQLATPFYPGSEYVNWIGADLYDRPLFTTFAAEFAPFYATFHTYGKPMILTETGSVGDSDQVPWLQNIASSLPLQFPDVHGVVYLDALGDLDDDYIIQPGGSGMAELEALGQDPYFDAPLIGFEVATDAGSVYTYGSQNYGSLDGHLNKPIVGMASTPAGSGYWLVASDGGIFSFGDAAYHGSTGAIHLNKPIVGMAATADGEGYWLVATDGGLFTFGDAKYHGSTGAIHLNKPIVGMAAAPGGRGYWLVASDGGIFTFGDSKFLGSTGGIRLNSPIVSMAATPDGKGYWLVAADGGVFCFGDAHYLGSLASTKTTSPVVGMSVDDVTGQYRVVTAAGSVYEYPGGALSSTPDGTPDVAIVTAS
jgi:hypothetical protein